MSASMKRHIEELVTKKKVLIDLKKEIKSNPDNRYVKRKEIGGEVKELEALICDEMDDGDEVMIGRRRFKKQRTANAKYTKERIYEFCEGKSIDPATYDTDNAEEKVALKVIGK